MKSYPLLIMTLLPVFAHATGMAVSLNNLYLQNFTSKPVKVKISNLSESYNQFEVPSKGICKINQQIMFLPPDYPQESGNHASYAISVNTETTNNPIVMDKYGLSLASDSFINAPYSGNVSQYRLIGFCGNKYSQYKFLNVTPHNGESGIPDFHLINCNNTSNFVYLINDKYIRVKNKQKKINFNSAPNCNLAP
ncbi:MAG: hypothetical protein EKK57_04450 [Proteobacteria bacterium]|nr:MAG: hypothetical protein EKK57_04450 [Pseudomonadota bacterium]